MARHSKETVTSPISPGELAAQQSDPADTGATHSSTSTTQTSADTAPSAPSTDNATTSSGGSVSAGTGRGQTSTASKILGVGGELILTIGIVIMLFVIYEPTGPISSPTTNSHRPKASSKTNGPTHATPSMPTRAKPWESCAFPHSVQTGTTPLSRVRLPVTSAAGPGTTPELKTPGTKETSHSQGTVSAEVLRLMTWDTSKPATQSSSKLVNPGRCIAFFLSTKKVQTVKPPWHTAHRRR